MATIYPRKSEMDAAYVKPAAADAAFRFTGEFLQVKDSATGDFSSVWLANGVKQIGEPEE